MTGVKLNNLQSFNSTLLAQLSYVQFGVPETHGKSSYEIQQSLKNEYMDIDEEKRSLLGKR